MKSGLCFKDAGVPRQSTMVNLVVEVSDAQDQGPLFTNAPLTIVVEENAALVSIQDEYKTPLSLFLFLFVVVAVVLKNFFFSTEEVFHLF